MEFSRYNLYLKDHPQKNYTTIYNLFSRRFGCFRTSLLFPAPSDKITEILSKKGILVSDSSSESNRVEKYYQDAIFSRKRLSITLLLTEKCNCKCCYCYERDQNKLFSPILNPDAILKAIDDYINTYHPDQLYVTYFGGEPLLEKKKISAFSEYFFRHYENIYRGFIITNGTLIDGNDVLNWEEHGLKGLKITVDGSRKIHDVRRCYENGHGTYDDIMNNLALISAISNVEIKINTIVNANSDINDYRALLEDIDRRGIKSRFSINHVEPCDSTAEEKAGIFLRYASLLKELNRYQYTKLSIPHGEICEAKQCGSFVVDGGGFIYPCNAILNSSIGNLTDGIVNFKKEVYSYPHDCILCKYLPVCFGDCPYDFNCKKSFFEYFLPKILKVYINSISAV